MRTREEDIYETAYLAGYVAAESKFEVNSIRRRLYYVALIAALVGYMLGVTIGRT